MTYPNDALIKLTIGGQDMTSHLFNPSFSVVNVLTRQVDSLDFLLINMSGINVVEWQEVILTDGPTKLFGGFVIKPKRSGIVTNDRVAVSCGDYAAYTDHIIVKVAYANKTDAYILNDLFSTYFPEINSTTFVTAYVTHSNKQFNRKKLREIIDELASAANADWYIDYDKKLHFFQNETSQSPFSISSQPNYVTSFPCQNLEVQEDGTGIVNLVEVVGGIYLSDDQTIYLPGTGKSNRVLLPYRMRGPASGGGLQVSRNDGSDASPIWTTMTVKVAYISVLGATTEVLFYYEEKVIEQQNNFPNLQSGVRIFGRYEIPLRVRVRDDASYALYGRWFYDYINDPNLIDKQSARLVGKARLAAASIANPTITFKTFKSGLRAGQRLAIYDHTKNINGTYIIQKVTMNDRGGAPGQVLVGYDVECGVYNPDLIDTLLEISRNAKPSEPWNDNEVLDELLQWAESITLLETPDSPRTTAPPYKWASDANPIIWDFFTWS